MAMPTFAAGHIPTAAELKQLTDQIDSLTAPGWTSYTPTFTTSGTAPSIGNGSITGRYRRAASGDLVTVQGILTFGSTTTVGTGTIYVSVPVTASATAVSMVTTGTSRIFDSGVANYTVTCYLDTTTRLGFIGTAGVVTNTWQTWNTSDFISWFIQYEPA